MAGTPAGFHRATLFTPTVRAQGSFLHHSPVLHLRQPQTSAASSTGPATLRVRGGPASPSATHPRPRTTAPPQRRLHSSYLSLYEVPWKGLNLGSSCFSSSLGGGGLGAAGAPGCPFCTTRGAGPEQGQPGKGPQLRSGAGDWPAAACTAAAAQTSAWVQMHAAERITPWIVYDPPAHLVKLRGQPILEHQLASLRPWSRPCKCGMILALAPGTCSWHTCKPAQASNSAHLALFPPAIGPLLLPPLARLQGSAPRRPPLAPALAPVLGALPDAPSLAGAELLAPGRPGMGMGTGLDADTALPSSRRPAPAKARNLGCWSASSCCAAAVDVEGPSAAGQRAGQVYMAGQGSGPQHSCSTGSAHARPPAMPFSRPGSCPWLQTAPPAPGSARLHAHTPAAAGCCGCCCGGGCLCGST